MFHVNSASRRLEQAHQRLLPQLVRERPTDGRRLREQRLPALPRLLRPQARRTSGSSTASAAPRRRRQRGDDRARASAAGPLVSMTRVATGPEPRPPAPPGPAIRRVGVRRVAPAVDHPLAAGPPGRRSRARPRRRSATWPPSTSLIASIDDGRRAGRSTPPRSSLEDPRPDGRMDDRLELRRARPGRANTIRPSAARSSAPSGRPDAVPERARIASWAGSPGRGISRATTSASMTTRAPLREPARDRRLAAADRPGQPDPDVRPRAGRAGVRHGARSSSSSHASSAAASAASTSASSLVTRRSSTKFAATAGSPSASSSWFLRSPRRVSSASTAAFWRR